MTDVFHDLRGMTFAGVPTAQFWCDFLLWEKLLNVNPQLQQIVEIGSWQGGFSRFLYCQAEARGMTFRTFDAVPPTVPPPCFQRLDVFSPAGAKQIIDLISVRPTALFCDGGNKPRELRQLAVHANKESLVFVHDWGTETLPTDVPDGLIEVYGDYCDQLGSMTRVFRVA